MDIGDYVLSKRGNMCKPAIKKIKEGLTARQLLQLYIDNIDFCLSENFPCNTDLKLKGGALLKEFGIYLDEHVKECNLDNLIMLGASSGVAQVTDGFVSKIYLKQNSLLTLTALEDALVIVDLFDESKLRVIAKDRSKVIVNIYGKAKVEADANHRIKINYKLKDSY